MSKKGTLALYDVTLQNGDVVQIKACDEKAALRIAADYWLVPIDEKKYMTAASRGLVKDLDNLVI